MELVCATAIKRVKRSHFSWENEHVREVGLMNDILLVTARWHSSGYDEREPTYHSIKISDANSDDIRHYMGKINEKINRNRQNIARASLLIDEANYAIEKDEENLSILRTKLETKSRP